MNLLLSSNFKATSQAQLVKKFSMPINLYLHKNRDGIQQKTIHIRNKTICFLKKAVKRVCLVMLKNIKPINNRAIVERTRPNTCNKRSFILTFKKNKSPIVNNQAY